MEEKINIFLQDKLKRENQREVTAIDANKWLEAVGLLKDNHQRPGSPLRKLLRSGRIRGAKQKPDRPYGRWFIKRVEEGDGESEITTDEKIRNDIYPRLVDTPLWTREGHIDVLINECYKAMEQKLGKKSDFINYLNKIERPEDAELLIDVLSFYNKAKNYAEDTFIKVIMMISCIEKIAVEKHMFFQDWLLKYEPVVKERVEKILIGTHDLHNDFKKLVSELKDEYNKEYGSSRKVRTFLSTHLTEDEKINLIRCFRLKHTSRAHRFSKRMEPGYKDIETIEDLKKTGRFSVNEALMPSCYSWESCYVDYGQCCPEIYCTLRGNKSLDETLKEIIDVIYGMRSKFVHNAKMFNLPKKDVFSVLDVYMDKGVSIEMKIEAFEEMFENCLKRFFNKKLK